MRKFEKTQMLELLNTMKDANGMVHSLFQQRNMDEFQSVLASEQEAAVSIGTQLEEIANSKNEKMKKKCIHTVELLEKYCEKLWSTNNSDSEIVLEKNIEDLDGLLNTIMESIQQIPTRLEVVFMPYKASMWDCMETVWMAAKEDPECDVYVIPIPYYDINPDGSAGQGHYEANEMPKYVPITSFREYDISVRRPDVIYIHNPYDGYNKVTSVHPDFYSSNLKQYTDMLVYIPYFLCGERIHETQILLPAYIHADKIVLQGEEMVDDIDESISRDKFILGGSPKTEKLIWMETHKDELEIPKEWKTKIAGKKVAFYNVSITGLLQDKEKTFDKMEVVFSTFENNQNIIMLFRPHPLLESTIASMYPEWREKYQKLINRVQRMSNAIYDTTADVSMSVVISDVYVGEYSSSVVFMFKALNKPAFFLSDKQYYQPTAEEMISDMARDMCKVGDDVWFIAMKNQTLCKYSLKDETLEYVAKIPDTDVAWDYHNIIHYEDKIILPTCLSNAICIYDIGNDSYRKEYLRESDVATKFCRGEIVYKESIFFIPAQYPAIMKYNMLNSEFTYYEEPITAIKERMQGEIGEKGSEYYCFRGVQYGEHKICITCFGVNSLLIFDMETGEYEMIEIGDNTNRFANVLADENAIWLTMRGNFTVLRVDKSNHTVKRINCGPRDNLRENDGCTLTDMGEYLYVIPSREYSAVTIDKVSGEVKEVEWLQMESGTSGKTEYFKNGFSYRFEFVNKLSDTEIIACSSYDNSFVIINIVEKTTKIIPIRLKDILKIEARHTKATFYHIWESDTMPLSKYLELVSQDLLDANRKIGIPKPQLDTELKAGAVIHQEVKKAQRM